MKQTRIALALIAAVALVGCGGETPDDLANFYVGQWSGAWAGAAGRDTGALSMIVAIDGALTGSFSRDSDGLSGGITGTVDKDGEFTGVADFATGSDYTLEGAVTRDGTNLVATFTYDSGTRTEAAQATLIKPGS